MRRIATAAVGLYAYLTFVLLLIAYLAPVALARLVHRRDPTRRVPGRWVRRLGRACGSAMPLWRFSIEGSAPPAIRSRAYVVVANHESSADPFLLSRLPWDMRWVAKDELFRLPIAGWILRMGGDVPIRRGRGGSVRAMLEACRSTLRDGLPVMLFPEGTRSPDGALLPFRDGAFELAIEAGVPVVPIALAGTRDCRPKGSLWFGRAGAKARILEPVSTEGMTIDDVPALRERVRDRIGAEVAAMRRRAVDPATV
ncbi:MAG TPA: lysophospholipid acyltransferase family protein [Vulgatibacter sp.]